MASNFGDILFLFFGFYELYLLFFYSEDKLLSMAARAPSNPLASLFPIHLPSVTPL